MRSESQGNEPFGYSRHARAMLRERNIPEEWVERTLADFERQEQAEDGTMHYVRPIREHGGRRLRVVINPSVTPRRVVTVFFDRRLRGPQ